MKNSVPPNIQTSYQNSDEICCAGKNTRAMPRIVVRNPLDPARNIVSAAVLAFRNRLGHGKLHQRAKHIDERDKLQHHRQ